MEHTRRIVLAVLVLMAGALLAVLALRPLEPAMHTPQDQKTDRREAAERRVHALEAAGSERRPVATGSPSSDAQSKLVAEPGTRELAIAGLVLDLEGMPVADAAVAFCHFGGEPDGEPVRSDAAGRFELRRPATSGTVRVVDEALVTVLEPHLYDDVVHDALTIVVAPAIRLAGVVIEADGRPVADARIFAVLGVDRRARIPRVLDRCVSAEFGTTSGVDGTFAIARAPDAADLQLLVSATGYRQLVFAAQRDRTRQRIVLARANPGDDLTGEVVDEQSRPLPGARVSLGDVKVTSDDRGRFTIGLWRVTAAGDGAAPELIARAPGHVAARLRPLAPDWRSRAAWPGHLTLRIGGPGLRISGRVVHADGTPVDSARVSFAPPGPEAIDDDQWQAVPSGPGTFRTRAVEPGLHRLLVIDPSSWAELQTEPIAAGTEGLVIRMPDVPRWPPLRGVVVDRRGGPCAGADWLVERSADPATGRAARQGDWRHADEQGVIEHPPLSTEIDTLCVKAAGMAEWVRVPISSLRADGFRIVVPIGCQARIEAGPQGLDATQAALENERGERAPVVITQGNVAFGTRTIPLDAGRSQTFVALDDCITLVLLRDGAVVHRAPIVLHPGRMNLLQP